MNAKYADVISLAAAKALITESARRPRELAAT
jgi:hypothetical protein